MEWDRKGFWNTLKARWYLKGLKLSNLPDAVLETVLPKTTGLNRFLDVGAGCGTLAIPLARAGKEVTALDPSGPMIAVLNEEAEREELKNIRTIQAAWGEVDTGPQDVVICANVPELLRGSRRFLEEAARKAGKAVFLVEGADPGADKFYYRELYPIIFNREYPERDDYIKTYVALHKLGIFANVTIIEYDFDQPFDHIDEAVAFWKEYMGLVTGEYDSILEKFLSEKLERPGDGLVARFRKKAAIMWWFK